MPTFNENVGINDPFNLNFNSEAFVSKSDLYGTKGLAVGSGAADSSGHLVTKRLFVGEQPGDNPQGANYMDGVRITQKWIGVDPNSRSKWMGLYIFNSIQQMTASTASTQDLYGANIQTGIYDPAAPIPRNFFQVFGALNLAYHHSPGHITNILGCQGRSLVQGGTADAAYGVNGVAALQNAAGVTNVAYGVSGQVRVENAGGTIGQASAIRAVVGLNAGSMTNAHGVLVENVAIGGSGTGKYGLYIQPQTVATPGNWTNVENLHSAGDVPNVFEGLIRSTKANGAPINVASTVVCPNLNADLLDGFEGSAFAQLAASQTFTGGVAFGSGVASPAAGSVSLRNHVFIDNPPIYPWSDGAVVQGQTAGFFIGRGGDAHFNTNAYHNAGWKYMAATLKPASVLLYNGDVTMRSATNGVANAAFTFTETWKFKNIASGGHFLAATDNLYDIGSSGAGRPRSGYFAASVSAGTSFKVGANDVVTARKTGWTADTGTAKRTANATYSGTAEAAYTQATIQALMNTVRDLTQTVKALKDDLMAHGLVGA
jgi:hypothetical protein